MTTILAIDVGALHNGFAVFEGRDLVQWGCINGGREELAARLDGVHRRWRLEAVVLEVGHVNGDQALAGVLSFLQGWAKERELVVVMADPRQVRRCLTGMHDANKDDLKAAVLVRFGRLGISSKVRYDVTDAVATGCWFLEGAHAGVR